MYNNPSAQQPQGFPSGLANAQQPQAPQPGLSTEIKELIEVAAQNSKLVYSLRSALGISYPENGQAKEPDSSMASAIRSVRFEISRTNDNLGEILAHIQN